MKLAMDAGIMCTPKDPGAERVTIRYRFPSGTRVEPGQGRFENEIWMLVGDECTEDWNYWIVLLDMETLGDWVIHRTVPWWGPYDRDWHKRQLTRFNPSCRTKNPSRRRKKKSRNVQHARLSNPPNA